MNLAIATALLLSSSLAPGQARADLQRAERALTAATVFVGRVLTPEGLPARGAVVVTSAGGRAVSAADGSFVLAVDVPFDAECVDVTAVAGPGASRESLVASARVLPAALSATTPVGSLALVPSGNHPRWRPGLGGQPGTNEPVRAFTVFDDGSGPALFAGGDFAFAGVATTSGLAKWDGASWSALGDWLGAETRALAVFDDGGGPELYAAGQFTYPAGQRTRVQKWDGWSWAALGDTTGEQGFSGIRALAVFDDGGGPALYAGGQFTTIDGVAASKIARWDGASWTPLGSGMGTGALSSVDALAVFDDGGGPALYAGGDFTTAGGAAASNVARWDGSSWSDVGGGISGPVRAFTVFDDGGGRALFAGGTFFNAGGGQAIRIARWDGSSWSGIGNVQGGSVDALAVFDDGTGSALYVGGDFSLAGGVAANGIARWDGSIWEALGGGMSHAVRALGVFDDGGGPVLYAGGDFTTADGVSAEHVARWRAAASRWTPLENGPNAPIKAFAAGLESGESVLYAGGYFTSIDGVAANRVARWDGSRWTALGSGIEGDSSVDALAHFDDGSGPALYVAGQFQSAGGVSVRGLARWDGTSWSEVGSGWLYSSHPYCLAVFDDGSGPALYVGGHFSNMGGMAANNIARWDGSAWTPLGSGTSWHVFALAVYDDGSGPALHAGGSFESAGGAPASHVAKWDGSSWSALGNGVNNTVYSLAVFDDGNGPGLYAGGGFTVASGVAARSIARWNGSSWSRLEGGANSPVYSLAVFDDGGGPALYAGGDFTTAGVVAARRIARWDGTSWSTLGSGMSGTVGALTSFEDAGGLALHAGGSFHSSPAGDSYFARWGKGVKVGRRNW